MDQYYSEKDCLRKSDQHSVMASMALQDGDKVDAEKQAKLSQIWKDRAREGGYLFKN